jgi:glycosyltransferase involved in cell wall biosynthesis
MKGITVSTFSSKDTSPNRIEVIRKTLTSIKDAMTTDTKVVIVNDGSVNKLHLALLDEFRSVFDFIDFDSNKGISSAKNAGIKHLYDAGCNVMFVMDDDIQLIKGFDSFYINAITKSGIHHFCYKVPELNKHITERLTINGIKLTKTLQVNGAFFTVTKRIVDAVGYFKILPYRYGHEHTEYTGRIIKMTNLCPGYIDVDNSNDLVKYIGLDHRSDNFPGIGDARIKENAAAAFGSEKQYVPFKLK